MTPPSIFLRVTGKETLAHQESIRNREILESLELGKKLIDSLFSARRIQLGAIVNDIMNMSISFLLALFLCFLQSPAACSTWDRLACSAGACKLWELRDT